MVALRAPPLTPVPVNKGGGTSLQYPLPWLPYGIPWSFRRWNRGEPRKLFLMVCSRDLQGLF